METHGTEIAIRDNLAEVQEARTAAAGACRIKEWDAAELLIVRALNALEDSLKDVRFMAQRANRDED